MISRVRNSLFRSFALSLTKNEQIARKTDERIPNPDDTSTLWNVGTMKCRPYETVGNMKLSTIWNIGFLKRWHYTKRQHYETSALWNCRLYETVDYMKLSTIWKVLSLCKCWQCETSWHRCSPMFVYICFVYTEIFRVSTLFVPVFMSPFLNTSNINIFVGGRL